MSFARPPTLMEAFALARSFEARIDETKAEFKTGQRWNPRNSGPSSPSSSGGSNASANSVSGSRPRPNVMVQVPMPQSSVPNLPVKRLSYAEIKDKRERGLCYNCDDKWSPNHRCKGKYLLLFGDEEDDNEILVDQLHVPEERMEEEPLGDISSLHSLASGGKPRSLKLMGQVGATNFQVLIDSGSTHNFIRPELAEKLKLPTRQIQPFRVFVGNGDYLTCHMICPQVKLLLQGHLFSMDLHVLPIEGPSVVLGIQWLQSLGRVVNDYAKLQMEFMWDGKKIQLNGDEHVVSGPVTMHQLQALVEGEEIVQLYEVHLREIIDEETMLPLDSESSPLNVDAPSEIKEVLQQFDHLFHTPTSLPPLRNNDHRIHLLPGSLAVNVKPYRYPHVLKQTMTKIVEEMLQQGLVRPSHSPYSSPVLLVRKKDGTYRFCVDYRALNAVTIKDRFPIPTIDELLDELGKATIFTKLDLRSGYHQIRVHHRDIHKIAFRTLDRHFESTFQATMN